MKTDEYVLMNKVHRATEERLYGETSIFQMFCSSERAAEIFHVASEALSLEARWMAALKRIREGLTETIMATEDAKFLNLN